MRSFLASKFEMPPSPGRIIPMEGMRGFAALIVFFVHFHALFGERVAAGTFLYSAATIAGSFGHSGVDVFFLLSGLLINGVVMQGRSGYGRYLLHRLRRLYPTFAVIFAAYLLLSFAFPSESKIPQSGSAATVYVLANLAMLPGILNIVPMITVAWSLSYELAFYLALPLVVKALALRRWRSGQRIAFFLFLAAAQTVLCVAGNLVSPSADHVRFRALSCGKSAVTTHPPGSLALGGSMSRLPPSARTWRSSGSPTSVPWPWC